MYALAATKEFFVGIDSDGCAFDTMELKHKECFIPNIIKHYGLQGVSKYARETAEFVNLYSKSRGINRFPALIETMQWLSKRPEVASRGVTITIPRSLVAWIAEETKLGNPALQAKVAETQDPDLKQALDWSLAVNDAITEMVHGVAPFPLVRESLERLSKQADMLVVSATPNAALRQEWNEHGIDRFVTEICGQESGNKKETLANASKYKPNHALMIGDAPGDQRAAQANNCLFFPINPGDEEASWEVFFHEGIDRFLAHEFDGDYQAQLIAKFETYLPAEPSW